MKNIITLFIVAIIISFGQTIWIDLSHTTTIPIYTISSKFLVCLSKTEMFSEQSIKEIQKNDKIKKSQLEEYQLKEARKDCIKFKGIINA